MKKLIYISLTCFCYILSSKAASIDLSCQFSNGLCGGYEATLSGNAHSSTGYFIRNSNNSSVYGVSGGSTDPYLALFYDIVVSTKSTSNQTAIDYNLNLTNASNYTMAFWYILTDHSHHSGTGIFMSDNGGSSFTKIFDFEKDEEVWHSVQINITSLAAQYGLNLNNQVVLRIKYAFDVNPTLGHGVGIDNLVFGNSTCNSLGITINQSTAPQLGGEFLNGWYGTNGNISIGNTTISSGKSIITQCGNNSSITLGSGFICQSGSSFKASCDYSCSISFKSAKISSNNYENEPKLEITIFPNPTSGVLTIKPNVEVGSCEIQIIDINGRKVFETEKTLNSDGLLNLAGLSSGLYLVKINTERGTYTQKVLLH